MGGGGQKSPILRPHSLWTAPKRTYNRDTFTYFDISKSKFNLQALREEEKMRNRVNKRLPKAVEDITNWMDELQKKGKHFRIRGMTFDELNAYQGTIHIFPKHLYSTKLNLIN